MGFSQSTMLNVFFFIKEIKECQKVIEYVMLEYQGKNIQWHVTT
jgi:hypothetical protein